MKNLIRKVPGSAGIEILVNFVLPYLIYVKAEHPIGPAHALMFASLPPVAWSVIEFARKRRVDALSMLVIAGIVLSLFAFLGGGSVKFLQLRENLVTGLIGLVFLGSAAIGRPLIYQLARATMLRRSQSEAERLEGLRDNKGLSSHHDPHDIGLGIWIARADCHRLRARISYDYPGLYRGQPNRWLWDHGQFGAVDLLVCQTSETTW
jgi:hypothetical protein